ncbi:MULTISPECIES: urease subunit alpha [Streptococcus]|jgi:urease subunit alpha|uniref:Urease subunit alpha n=2 Tax=Streptococcus TaxID=1301 RepID=A0A2X3UGY5_STRTR|nr:MULTISPECIES: urease subunit alpha [Streptococcus]AXN96852.1 urease subunit alpha [Streptococcus thermophilus]EWM62481.1 urease subunit alpha [Streptococcus thermophilus TH1477]MCT0003861.1 urease subunit alpha [Streptococcus thermophilus]MCT2902210.1 urease subunit alpha [Streptococcus thermophilus]QOH30903.1 urease subunit alpha [Streptococcus thermophilus]
MSFKMDREEYAQHYGPTVGDSVRLGDTNLFAAIEKDFTVYGQESKFGGGKVLRDGMGVSATETRDNPSVVDTIITGATIIDYTGIIKADIGIRDGKIVAIGRGGNPDTMDNVDFVVGASTEAIAAEGLIVTAGGIDLHVHYISADLPEFGLDNGITTLFGGGTGPADGSNATTCTPGKFHITRMLQAVDDMPANFGFLAKGVGSETEVVEEQIKAGAAGIKTHEDWGATYAGIDNSLKVADKYDVSFAVHTDSLNEGGFMENTLESFQGRTVHTFHTEGSGGGHAPDIMVFAGKENILPSSTNPTNPYTTNAIGELLDMVMVCHHLDPKIPEDVSFAESRVRKQTVAAEDVLHDMGALSIMTSDAMAMGRVGEVAMRCWQLADKMKAQRGPLEGDSEFNDNNRIKRYVAKYTINPAITNGIADYIGSVEVGKFADLVIWEPAQFGAKPKLVLKGGMLTYGVMGDAGSSLPTPQPRIMRKLYGAYGQAVHKTNLTFVSQYAYDHGIKEEIGLNKIVLPVKNTRNLTKRDMKLNDYAPKTIRIDPQTFDVFIDDELVTCEPIHTTSLSQRYFLF